MLSRLQFVSNRLIDLYGIEFDLYGNDRTRIKLYTFWIPCTSRFRARKLLIDLCILTDLSDDLW